jgi:hypothetical protein
MSMRVFGSLLVVLIMVCTLFAAEKTNFSGEWMFNEEKSVLDEMGRAFIPYKLVITQGDNELTVQKTFTMENGEDMITDENMTLDGKECKSEIWNSPRITTANWTAAGDTLNIEMKITFNQDGNNNEMLLQEAWSLQDEGIRMVINHFSSSTWGERKITMIFDKQKPKQ